MVTQPIWLGRIVEPHKRPFRAAGRSKFYFETFVFRSPELKTFHVKRFGPKA